MHPTRFFQWPPQPLQRASCEIFHTWKTQQSLSWIYLRCFMRFLFHLFSSKSRHKLSGLLQSPQKGYAASQGLSDSRMLRAGCILVELV